MKRKLQNEDDDDSINNKRQCIRLEERQSLPMDVWNIITTYLNNRDIYRLTLCLSKSLYTISWQHLNFESNNSFAIKWTTINNRLTMLRQMLDHDRISQQAAEKAIELASYQGNYPIVRLLLNESKYDTIVLGHRAIIGAVHHNNANILNVLLKDNRFDPTADGNKALRISCAIGSRNATEILLRDTRCNVCEPENKPLKLAVMNGHKDIVLLLKQYGAIENLQPMEKQALVQLIKEEGIDEALCEIISSS
jgi:hypothetical protein